jgi:hypothetical protein
VWALANMDIDIHSGLLLKFYGLIQTIIKFQKVFVQKFSKYPFLQFILTALIPLKQGCYFWTTPNRMTLYLEIGRHASDAIKGCSRMLFIKLVHQQ